MSRVRHPPFVADWPRALFLLILAIGGLAPLFWRDGEAMAALWLGQSTYHHCLFVPAIVAGLIWQKRQDLVQLTPRFFWPGLVFVGASAFCWMIGTIAGIALARHLALVLTLLSLVMVILGPAVVRCLAFPLAFAVFAVPFGDELVPQLQVWTAQMASGLLHLVGVPAYLDGIFLVTSNGLYRVAEACAGVKFLLAMVAYGALFAYLYLQSWRRRAGFFGLCIVVPILANGVRVFATVYVGYKTSPEVAGGVDHIVYGWVFFAVVMGGITAIGLSIRQAPKPQLLGSNPSHTARRPVSIRGSILAVLACVLPMFMVSNWVDITRSVGGDRLARPIAPRSVLGWAQSPRPKQQLPWWPVYRGADQVRLGHYRKDKMCGVDVAFVLYSRQEEGRELVSYGQGAAMPDAVWTWVSSGPSFPNARSDLFRGRGAEQRLVVTYFWVGNRLTGAKAAVKWATLWSRLTGQDPAAAVLLVSAVQQEAGMQAKGCIASFVQALGSPAAALRRALQDARS